MSYFMVVLKYDINSIQRIHPFFGNWSRFSISH